MFTHHIDDNLSHGASRLRTPTLENIREDLELLEKGILDFDSFMSGFAYHNHPVEAILTDKDQKLKSIRRSHNLRTDTGGTQQANALSGSVTSKANYIGLSVSTSAGSIVPATTDTALVNESGTSGQITGLSRVLAVFALTPITGGTSSTVQGTYKLTATWNNVTLSSNPSYVNGCAVFDAASIGNLWFEASITPISVGNGDNLSLSYTVNF